MFRELPQSKESSISDNTRIISNACTNAGQELLNVFVAHIVTAAFNKDSQGQIGSFLRIQVASSKSRLNMLQLRKKKMIT